VSSSITSTAASEISALSLHDALPIFGIVGEEPVKGRCGVIAIASHDNPPETRRCQVIGSGSSRSVSMPDCRSIQRATCRRCAERSEEHTSELQSRFDLVCRLLLEKKK